MAFLNKSTYSQEELKQIWEKGKIVQNYNPDIWRKDIAGAWIKFNDYGNINSIFGWEIDHSNPQTLGGSDNLRNKRPLQWKNNRAKSDKYPCDDYPVTSEGNRNIEKK